MIREILLDSYLAQAEWSYLKWERLLGIDTWRMRFAIQLERAALGLPFRLPGVDRAPLDRQLTDGRTRCQNRP